MAINVGDNFNYQGKKYLDNRQSFKTLSELQAYTNVPEGFIAYCEEDKKRYEYIDGSWREYIIDSSAGGETIDTSNFATKDELNTKFDDVSVNEEESTDGQTALDFFANGEKVKTVYFSGGGSGGGAAAYISTVLPEENMVETGQNFDIIIDFYSPNPGNGTLKVFVNDVDAISTKIAQGESTTTLSYEKLTKGTNKIVVYVLDRIGTMSNSLTFYVRYGSTELVGEFDSSIAYDYGANIRYYFKATALDTSLTLTFYMSIDGAIQNGVNCISDVRGYFTFSNLLEAGGHYCECWVEDSNGGKSNIESFNLVILDTNTLAIVTETRNPSVEEGAQLVLDYKVYKKNETTFITKTYIDDELVSTGTCGLTKSYYKSSSLPEGMHVIKIEAWDMTETVHDDVIWNVIITPSTYTMLQPIKAGSSFIATAVNRTNSDPNRSTWTGYNQDNTPIDATLVNFAFNSESGWMDDQIFITGKSHIEVPIKPLANNARYGFTLDIEFSSKPIGVDNAEVLTLWNDVDNCGIKITTDQLLLQSKTGNKCELYFSEEEIVSAIFVIDRNEKGAKIYLNGVMCAVFALSDYTAEGVSYLEDFTVDDYIYLGGKDKNGYSTIKNLRVYEIALSTDEILNNFMANEIDKTKQRELVEFQKGNELPTVTVYCDFSGLGKDDKKYCDIVYTSPDPVKYGESFALMGKYSQLQYQGTSSMQYPIKNYRLNPRDANGKVKIKLPNSQPETRFTLKADFMSSGHWQNTGLANWVNDNLYNYKEDDPKSMNPAKWWAIQNGQDPNDYRESIYGFPCRLILVNDGTTPLNAGQQEPTPGNTKDMGIFNFNLDKNCENSLGFKIKDFPNAVSMEVTANSDTSAGAFMSYSGDDYAGELAYIQESFEVRYGDEDTEGWGFMHVNNVEGTGIKHLIDWVDKSTDEQFVAEFEEHFHKDYTLRYFLLVMVLGMVDNLGKNMMLDSYDGKIWMPRFYDMDTICSYDNSGEIKFDVDIEMAQGYWNTSSSRLWTRVRDLFHNELIAKYKDMRQNGMSYESFMNYFYDGQIAKIPQKYYNMDADVKYIPYLGEYAGKAHGDGYEHLKRWLKNRLIFTDTLYDYAPSYTNDMLTFRANTTEQMSITIETYTPVYQHVSWYNGQMDKEKISRGTTHTFTGFAQAATDQEILIYGGSNIKRIIGISSMNPNSMLIGNATRIVELDISNCPILTTVNSNKANFSPHTYLNKLDISNCPQLGGSLRLNYSPLIQEINAFNTAVTDLQLPSSLRNLTVLKLPHLLTTLTLNDASLLETLEFDDITNLTEVSMTNCNALKNIVNFDMTTVPKVTLNNSYDVDEMYMSATTNLSLVNMARLERLIYLPNNEHETFNLTQLRNYPNYNISAINCPNLKTFMTTAPYRTSYNNGDYGEVQPNTAFCTNILDLSNTRMTDVKFLCTTDIYQLKLPDTVNNFICDSAYDLDTNHLPDGDFDTVHHELIEAYTTDYNSSVLVPHGNENEVYFKDMAWTKETGINSSGNVIWVSGRKTTDLIRVIPGTNITRFGSVGLVGVAQYDSYKKFISFIKVSTTATKLDDACEYIRLDGENAASTSTDSGLIMTLYQEVTPNLIPSAADGSLIFSMYAPTTNTAEPAEGIWDLYGLTFEGFYTYGMNNDIKVIDGVLTMPARCSDYNITIENANIKTTNHPTMLYPLLVNEEKPVTGIIDYTDYQGDDLSYAMAYANKSEVSITIPYNVIVNSKYIYGIATDSEYEYFDPRMVVRYITTSSDKIPTFNADYVGKYNLYKENNGNGTYTIDIISYNLSDMPTSITFRDDLGLTEIIYLNTSALTSTDSMFYGCKNLTSVNTDNWDLSNVTTMPTMFKYCLSLTSLNANGWVTSKTTNIEEMFDGCSKLETIDIGDWDTSNVTAMHQLFASCSKLTTLDTSGWNTSKVKSFKSMFNGCSNLETLNISGWNTSNVTDMQYMFYNCSKLTHLDLSHFNTSNVTTMTNMFAKCGSLIDINLSGFVKNKVNNPSSMFANCTSLQHITMDNWDTSSVTTLRGVFSNTSLLESLDLSGWDTSKVTDMYLTFSGCTNLKTLNLNNWDTSKVTVTTNMFANCSKLTSLSWTNWMVGVSLSGSTALTAECLSNLLANLAKITTTQSITVGSTNAAKLKDSDILTAMLKGWTIDASTDIAVIRSGDAISGNDTTTKCAIEITSDNVNTRIAEVLSAYTACTTLNLFDDGTPTDLSKMFTDNLKTSNYPNVAYLYFLRGYFQNPLNITESFRSLSVTEIHAPDLNASATTSFDNLFRSCANLTTLDVSGWNTSTVTTMTYAFDSCSKLTTLDTSGWDTSKVTNMSYAFAACSSLISLDLSNWNTSSVTNISYMFINSSKLTSLNVSNWNTSKVINAWSTFYNCSSLIFIDGIGDWVTSSINYSQFMFSNCYSLTTLDVSKWDVSNVINMSNMFGNCNSLTILDVSNWNTSKVTQMNNMFESCRALTTLDISRWNTSSLTDIKRMFMGCTKLSSLDFTGWDMSKIKGFGQFCVNCSSLESIIGLDLSSFDNFYGSFMSALSFDGCTNLKTIEDINVSFTITMGSRYSNSVDDSQPFWVGAFWCWFMNTSNIENITFTGQLGVWDTLSTYDMFKKCDTSKLTLETWNSFVNIFPEVSSDKIITMGKSQANLDAVPDSVKTALMNKGYSLSFQA